jgi:hypothetical protein
LCKEEYNQGQNMTLWCVKRKFFLQNNTIVDQKKHVQVEQQQNKEASSITLLKPKIVEQ